MSERSIGCCSICGGTVTVPTAWYGTLPPVPTCKSCGATAKTMGPVIEMEPRKQKITTNPYGSSDNG